MLHWLQPNIHKRKAFVFELILLSVLLHGCFFIGLFFSDNNDTSDYIIRIGSECIDLTDIVVVPQVIPIKQTQKPITPKKVSPIKKILPAVAQKKSNIPKKAPAIKKQATPILSSQKVVTQKEYDMVELQHLVQIALQENWQPPAGLAKDLSCKICIQLDLQGGIKNLDFVDPSGVLVYDIHAQSTLLALNYPRQAWGKRLTIVFEQA